MAATGGSADQTAAGQPRGGRWATRRIAPGRKATQQAAQPLDTDGLAAAAAARSAVQADRAGQQQAAARDARAAARTGVGA